MKFPITAKILTICGLILLLMFITFQVVMYIQHSYNIKHSDQATTTIDFSGFASTARWSIIFGLVGTALILGSTNVSLDITKARLGTSILGTLLLIACIVMEILSYISPGKVECSEDDKTEKCIVSDEQQKKSDMYHNMSIMFGILSISILSGSLQL
jgi:hypothetical protein